MAEASDKRIAAGTMGALEGLPLAIKDLFCTEGVLTTAASHILDGFTPPYESTVTANLWRDEFPLSLCARYRLFNWFPRTEAGLMGDEHGRGGAGLRHVVSV